MIGKMIAEQTLTIPTNGDWTLRVLFHHRPVPAEEVRLHDDIAFNQVSPIVALLYCPSVGFQDVVGVSTPSVTRLDDDFRSERLAYLTYRYFFSCPSTIAKHHDPYSPVGRPKSFQAKR
jgi:hypothetical protein